MFFFLPVSPTTPYTPLSSLIRATYPAHLILLDIITRTILGEEYKSLFVVPVVSTFGECLFMLLTCLLCGLRYIRDQSSKAVCGVVSTVIESDNALSTIRCNRGSKHRLSAFVEGSRNAVPHYC